MAERLRHFRLELGRLVLHVRQRGDQRACASRLDGLIASALVSASRASSCLLGVGGLFGEEEIRVDRRRVELERVFGEGDRLRRILVGNRPRRADDGRYPRGVGFQRDFVRPERFAVLILLAKEIAPLGIDGGIASAGREAASR